MKLNTYKLLDSGQNGKLEKFGTPIISRPSSLAVWKRRLGDKEWGSVQAQFDQEGQWKSKSCPEEWVLEEKHFKLHLRLQQNGQIGFFPEHASYLDKVQQKIEQFIQTGKKPSLLNLFAYTGMCSVVASKAGATVCHVDSSKSCLDWAKQNFDLNQINEIRLIKEDAISFLKKELKRNNKYDIVVLDPPGFSRFKEGDWKLVEIVDDLIKSVLGVLTPTGVMFFTFHGADLGAETLRNILLDNIGYKTEKIETSSLFIEEAGSGRRIPAGNLVVLDLNR